MNKGGIPLFKYVSFKLNSVNNNAYEINKIDIEKIAIIILKEFTLYSDFS
jgi:hypothetical protein